MGLKKINASQATVIPAKAEKTYDTWRVMGFNVRSNDNRTRLNAQLTKGVQDVNGNWEMSNQPLDNVRVVIDDLETAMDNDATLKAALDAMIDSIATYAANQNLV